jgi:hypothetical protein
MNKMLSLSGNIMSMLALLAFVGYMGLNTAFDLSTISQSADAEMFKDYRDMLIIPGLVLGVLGLGLSGAYVAKNKDELSSLEIAAPIAIPVLSLIGLALFAFVL